MIYTAMYSSDIHALSPVSYTHLLMDHLEFVGNALFIPYFLIGVGMLINLRVIFGEGDALKVAAVMITMALTGKWIACWLTQKIYKMSVLERNLMYGLSNAQEMCIRDSTLSRPDWVDKAPFHTTFINYSTFIK